MDPRTGIAILTACFLLTMTAETATAVDAEQVTIAVQKGAEFLRKEHAPRMNYNGGERGMGQAALIGIALLEAGIPATDPSLQQITNFVRTQGLIATQTYGLALAIMFLDRLNDPRDIPLIQVLGVRLYRGQNVAGGWTYNSWEEIPAIEAQRLAAVLYGPGFAGGSQAVQPPNKSGTGKETVPPASGFPVLSPDRSSAAARETPRLHPEAARQLLAVRRDIVVSGRRGLGSGDDNSNTQFALVGLWVAARHGLPIHDAFALIESRFLRTQNPADGGWNYSQGGASTPAMTCAGLLGLAAGAAARDAMLVNRPTDPAQTPDSSKPAHGNDPFFQPKKDNSAQAETFPESEAPPKNAREAALKAGLKALGQVLASTQQAAPPAGNPPPAAQQIENFVGLGNTFYLLWSVERVAVALNLPTIGGVDWYDWGAGYLLAKQRPDGSWDGSTYPADINTAFALLFLLKTNFTRDLSGKIKQPVTDPGRAELRGGAGVPALFAPPVAAPKPPADPRRASLPPISDPMFPTTSLPTGTLDLTPAETLARELRQANDSEWPARLQKLKTEPGGRNTLALAWAITELDGARRQEAREALAERLARMTTETRRLLLRDPEIEIRRAAALAIAMREESLLIPELIDRLTDPSEVVIRASRAALRSLTSVDFGPEPGAGSEARLKAATAWRTWYDSQNRAAPSPAVSE